MVTLTTSEQFAQMLQALSDDIVYANIHWQMTTELEKAFDRHPLVRAQSNTFWYLTFNAHVATALQRLCRAYDQEQSSLHLNSLLKTIRDNFHLFEKDSFKARLAGNPFVDSLAAAVTAPSGADLDADMLLCSTNDPLVRKLVAYRGSYVAHKSARIARRTSDTPSPVSAPTDGEVETLLLPAKTILNRYSYLF